MLTVLGHRRQVCNGLSRRTLLEAAGAGLFGLSLPDILAAEEFGSVRPARAKSVIFVFLFGGPSQLETFDIKPDAASGIRGPYRPIAARTPELRICEYLPMLANCSDRYCVVRTVNHPQNDHNGCHFIQTGQPMPPADRGAANVDATDKDFPAMGSVVEYLDLFGQSLLMGRRMIEAGARFVTIVWDMAVRGDARSSWDMHEGLTSVMKNHLLPGLDQGLSALLADMHESGLLEETLVVCVGEMGRTPLFVNRGQQDGRDHWSYCFPCLLAGAGVRGGVYGRSDKDAAYPAEPPVSPADLAATIYEALGIDSHQFLPDAQGRPQPLVTQGRALDEVFA